MGELYNIFPFIWWVFIISALTAHLSVVIGILANVIDWLFKPKFLFFHIVANILWSVGFFFLLSSLILILADHYIYDFIRPF